MSDFGGRHQIALGGDVVTGEAVVLDLRIAKLPSRAIARIIDFALQYALLLLSFVVLAAVGSGTNLDEAALVGIELLIVVLIVLGYPVIFETLSRGKTLGKMAMGLQVVRDDGGPVQFRQSLVRALMGIIEIWILFVIAVVASATSVRGKRVGDHLAGTVVVRVRMPRDAARMVGMPERLATWAAGLDLSRLPDDLALTARQFMARSQALRPEVREPMGLGLAQDVSRYVSPAPPAGVHPQEYLAAVLAERRRRDAARYPSTAAQPYAQQYPQPYPQQYPQPYAPAPAPPSTDPGTGFAAPS